MILGLRRPTVFTPLHPSVKIAVIHTARLRLLAITPAMIRAEQAADARLLGRLTHSVITSEWPPEHWEPHVLRFILKQYEDEPDTHGWHRFVLLQARRIRPVLIGAVGGFPKPNGEVEIGYSTLPAYQRKGFATEAATAFISWLLAQERVRVVAAQTYPHLPESIKVMQRCGMVYAGDGDEPGAVRYVRSHR